MSIGEQCQFCSLDGGNGLWRPKNTIRFDNFIIHDYQIAFSYVGICLGDSAKVSGSAISVSWPPMTNRGEMKDNENTPKNGCLIILVSINDR